MSRFTSSPTPALSFEGQVRAALDRVRAAVRQLVRSLLGKQHVRAADLEEALLVDTRLAWKLVKIMNANDPLGIVRYLPGERGVKLFLSAAEQRNAPEAAIKEARDAFIALEIFVRQEAGDRKSFDMMVAGHVQQTGDDPGLEHRRAAFEHSGFIWGVQARTRIHSYLIQPSGDGEFLDVAVVRGFVELRRLRPQIPWRISRFYSIDEGGHVRSEFSRLPIDPDCSPDETPLLRDFCSNPLPIVRRIKGRDGIVDDMLAESDVGNTQSVTCIMGELIRRADVCYRNEDNPGLGTLAPLRTPCELVVMDVFLHREFFGDVSPTLHLYGDLFKETIDVRYTDADALPCPSEIERLGDGVHVPPISEMPEYPDMIRYCFDRLNWDNTKFSCHRAMLAFPPMPASLLAEFPLPQRPD